MNLIRLVKIAKKDMLYTFFAVIKRKRKTYIPYLLQRLSAKRMLQKNTFADLDTVKVLNIITPDGTNQSVHPDILYVKDNMDKYIMCVNPYPYGYELLENPVLYQSSDLENWEYVSGPIDFPETSEGRRHFSDSALAKSGEYICLYRECLYDVSPPITRIYMQKSPDFKKWHGKELLFSSPMTECDIISPSIYYDENGVMHFYSCAKINDEMKLITVKGKKVSKDNFEEINLSWIPEHKNLWHMAAIPYKNGEIFLIVFADDMGGSNAELYLAIHKHYDDNTIKVVKKVKIKEILDIVEVEYRASGVVLDNVLKIVASVRYTDKTWGCVLLEEKNVEDLFE